MDSAADPGIFPLAVLAVEDPVNFAGEVVAEMPGRSRAGRTLAY